MLLLLRQSPKKVCAAVNTIAVKDERSRNVVIYGISESDGGRLENKVAEVLGEINEKPSFNGLVAQLVNPLALLEVPGSIPDSATSRGVSVVDVQLKILSGLCSPPVYSAEYSRNRV